jgi:hypothetical protein
MTPATFPPSAQGAYVATAIGDTVAKLVRRNRPHAAAAVLAGYADNAAPNLSVIPVGAVVHAIAKNIGYLDPRMRWAPDWMQPDHPTPVEVEACAWAAAMMNAATNGDRDGMRAAWGYMPQPVRRLVVAEIVQVLMDTNRWVATRARPS